MKTIPTKYLCSRCHRDLRLESFEGGCKCSRTHLCEIAISNKVTTFEERNETRLGFSYYSIMMYKEDHKN